MAFTRVVDRAFDEALIHAAEANIDGDYGTSHSLPSGFGDCALLEVDVVVTQIATIVAPSDVVGPSAQLVDAGGNAMDVGFSGHWIRTSATRLEAKIGPDQVQFWRAAESLRVTFSEVDSNVTPTADLDVYVKVRRLRPEIDQRPDPLDQQFFLTS